MSDTHVAHIGTSIMYIGSDIACQAHRDALPYNTDSWRISTFEEYGEACYDAGYDTGYDTATASVG